WFCNRLKAGFCMMRNPMNRRPIRVSLVPEDVQGIVFWTKNFRPFLRHLSVVEGAGFPYYVSYTINGYPRSLEHNVVDWEKSVEAVREIFTRHGKRAVVWRYDTIVFSEETPLEFHKANFARIADALTGLVDECVISFMQLYRKTERNLNEMSRVFGNPWFDPELNLKRELAEEFYCMALDRGISLTICTQPELITVQSPARCIDSRRLADLGGRTLGVKMLGNRPGCECTASRDIGDYDTCPHGCVYCYAVQSNTRAIERYKNHNPLSPFLFDDPNGDEGTFEGATQLTLDF
ncbi:MAG: DUF1848 domain-containing protein, partial [Armatimonadetes bacterium]|nr:DUF1848 domain-containing protein [Armatimonadota bacterium]